MPLIIVRPALMESLKAVSTAKELADILQAKKFNGQVYRSWKVPKPTNTQDLTARILSMLPGWTPEEQFFALLNAASHVASRKIKRVRGDWLEIVNKFKLNISLGGVLEELPEEKAPF